MFRAAVKLLLSDVRSKQSLSHPPAAEAGPPPKSGAGVGGRRMSVAAWRSGALLFASTRAGRAMSTGRS